MEDIGTLRIFIVFQILLIIVGLGLVIITIIRSKHKLMKHPIFKIMLATEFFAILLIINIIIFDIAIVYPITAVFSLIMMTLAYYSLKNKTKDYFKVNLDKDKDKTKDKLKGA